MLIKPVAYVYKNAQGRDEIVLSEISPYDDGVTALCKASDLQEIFSALKEEICYLPSVEIGGKTLKALKKHGYL